MHRALRSNVRSGSITLRKIGSSLRSTASLLTSSSLVPEAFYAPARTRTSRPTKCSISAGASCLTDDLQSRHASSGTEREITPIDAVLSDALPPGAVAPALDERSRAFRQEIAHHGLCVADQCRSSGRGACGCTAGDWLDRDLDEGAGTGRPAPGRIAHGVSAFPLGAALFASRTVSSLSSSSGRGAARRRCSSSSSPRPTKCR